MKRLKLSIQLLCQITIHSRTYDQCLSIPSSRQGIRCWGCFGAPHQQLFVALEGLLLWQCHVETLIKGPVYFRKSKAKRNKTRKCSKFPTKFLDMKCHPFKIPRYPKSMWRLGNKPPIPPLSCCSFLRWRVGRFPYSHRAAEGCLGLLSLTGQTIGICLGRSPVEVGNSVEGCVVYPIIYRVSEPSTVCMCREKPLGRLKNCPKFWRRQNQCQGRQSSASNIQQEGKGGRPNFSIRLGLSLPRDWRHRNTKCRCSFSSFEVAILKMLNLNYS